jgi:hypothetical protein
MSTFAVVIWEIVSFAFVALTVYGFVVLVAIQ